MFINIEKGWLETARHCPSPNCDERPGGCVPELIIIHNISLPPNEFDGNWIDHLFTNTLDPNAHDFFAGISHLRVASHILIRRTGEIVQYVPFNKRAFHAGVSEYGGRSRCNDFSVGIELEGTDFVPFTDAQYQQLETSVRSLCHHYRCLSFEHITGHEHVAPGRKTDPGPFFDWGRLGASLGVALPAPAC